MSLDKIGWQYQGVCELSLIASDVADIYHEQASMKPSREPGRAVYKFKSGKATCIGPKDVVEKFVELWRQEEAKRA